MKEYKFQIFGRMEKDLGNFYVPSINASKSLPLLHTFNWDKHSTRTSKHGASEKAFRVRPVRSSGESICQLLLRMPELLLKLRHLTATALLISSLIATGARFEVLLPMGAMRVDTVPPAWLLPGARSSTL